MADLKICTTRAGRWQLKRVPGLAERSDSSAYCHGLGTRVPDADDVGVPLGAAVPTAIVGVLPKLAPPVAQMRPSGDA
jgi:hypothetical protein